MQEAGGNIRVVVRIRPLPADDSGQFVPWSITDQTMTQIILVEGRPCPGQTFQFGTNRLL
jgi:hypothetical protein